MRDEQGELVRNAHLLGFFRRIFRFRPPPLPPLFPSTSTSTSTSTSSYSSPSTPLHKPHSQISTPHNPLSTLHTSDPTPHPMNSSHVKWTESYLCETVTSALQVAISPRAASFCFRRCHTCHQAPHRNCTPPAEGAGWCQTAQNCGEAPAVSTQVRPSSPSQTVQILKCRASPSVWPHSIGLFGVLQACSV